MEWTWFLWGGLGLFGLFIAYQLWRNRSHFTMGNFWATFNEVQEAVNRQTQQQPKKRRRSKGKGRGVQIRR